MADVATLVFDIDSADARGAARALADLNSAAIKAANGASRFDRQMRNAKGQFQSTSKYVSEHRGEIESLARAYNPVLAAQLRYRDESVRTAMAVRAGVITEQQRVDILQRMKSGYDTATASAQRFGAAQQQTGHHTANVFAQLNDIGVMLAAGQNPIQLALQQGTQLNQVWASMGAQGRTLGGVARMLGGAFATMLSPMNLLTIGTIAGTAALTQWWFAADDADKKAVSLEDNLGNLATAAKSYAEAVKLVDSPISSLTEKFGTQAEAMRRLYEIQARLQRIEFVNNLATANNQLQTTFQGLTESVARLEAAMNLPGYMREEQVSILREEMQRLNREFGIGSADARDFAQELSQLANARGPESASEALQKVTERLLIAKERGAEVPPELIRVAMEAATAAGQVMELTTALQAAGVAASNVVMPVSAGMTFGTGAWATGLKPEDLLPPHVKQPKARGGGRAAAELRAAEKGFQSLRELLEQDSLFQVAEYEKRQTQLDEALKKRLLSEQNYQVLKSQLQTLYFGTEFEKQGLQYLMEQQQLDQALAQKKISEERHAEEISRIRAAQASSTLSGYQTLFGNMASIVSAGGNKTNAAYKAFAIAQGLISARLAYLQVLADPALIGRPFLRTALAYSTMAAGLAQVAAMGGGGGKGSSASTAQAAARSEPERQVLVRLEGDEWLVGMAEGIMTEIYEQTGNGRVVVQRDYS